MLEHGSARNARATSNRTTLLSDLQRGELNHMANECERLLPSANECVVGLEAHDRTAERSFLRRQSTFLIREARPQSWQCLTQLGQCNCDRFDLSPGVREAVVEKSKTCRQSRYQRKRGEYCEPLRSQGSDMPTNEHVVSDDRRIDAG